MSAKDTLTRRQRRGIAALLVEKTIDKAAAAARISPRQMYRWLASPVFVSELRRSEALAIDEAARLLVRTSAPAVRVLAHILKDGDASPASKVSAARVILESMLRVRELSVFEQRLAALEEHTSDGSN